MIERIFKSWKTSLAGVLVFLAGLLAVLFEYATLSEFGAFLAVTLGLLFVNDPKKPSGGAVVRGAAFILFMVLLITYLIP